jgi:hypothetical protein
MAQRLAVSSTERMYRIEPGGPRSERKKLANVEVGFLDWACVRRGNWAFDVCYFLVSALDVADRRAFEVDLVEEYREELDVPPEELPTREQAWLRYRTTPPDGLAVWLATRSSINYQGHEICGNLVHRYAAAFVDLGTRSAVVSLEGSP